MKRLLLLATFALVACASAADAPLRIFIRSGPKSHGPGAHDYPRFLKEWVPLLNARGAQATGADAFPTAAQLAATDGRAHVAQAIVETDLVVVVADS